MEKETKRRPGRPSHALVAIIPLEHRPKARSRAIEEAVERLKHYPGIRPGGRSYAATKLVQAMLSAQEGHVGESVRDEIFVIALGHPERRSSEIPQDSRKAPLPKRSRKKKAKF